MEDYLLHLAKAYSPGLVGGAFAPEAGVAPAAAEVRPAAIREGTLCVAKAAGAIFAGPSSWERIGRIAKGQEVVAAGEPVSADGFHMVPILPAGAVDRALLQVLSSRIERPSVVGSWSEWSPEEMAFDEASRTYRLRVRLSRPADFQIVLCGNWMRCLHPEVDGLDPRADPRIVGPDDDGRGKCWTMGADLPADASEQPLGLGGQEYEIGLALDAHGAAKSVSWSKVLDEAPPVRPAVGEPADDGLFRPKPGHLARICGLQKTPGLNGEPCFCDRWDASVQRWTVLLKSGEVKALKPLNLEEADAADFAWWHGEGLEGLRRGRRVCVRGLGGLLDFNGEGGACERWDEERGRWHVRLASGRLVSVRPENLQAEDLRATGAQVRASSQAQDGLLGESPVGIFLQATRRDAAAAAPSVKVHQAPPDRRLRLGVDVRPRRLAARGRGPPERPPRRGTEEAAWTPGPGPPAAWPPAARWSTATPSGRPCVAAVAASDMATMTGSPAPPPQPSAHGPPLAELAVVADVASALDDEAPPSGRPSVAASDPVAARCPAPPPPQRSPPAQPSALAASARVVADELEEIVEADSQPLGLDALLAEIEAAEARDVDDREAAAGVAESSGGATPAAAAELSARHTDAIMARILQRR